MKKTKIHIGIAALVVAAATVAIVIALTSTAKSYSNEDFKNSAAVFLQGAEMTGTPITLRVDSNYYYYVPFEVNSTLNTQFPGVMLDKSGTTIADETLLKNLFLYPSLIKEFSSNINGFNELAVAKTAAFAKQCRILDVQSTKFAELNMQGNVAGIFYHGTKLAFDAVGIVKSTTAGLAKLIKDFAKDAVKNSIVSYISKTDSREILKNTQKADDSARNAKNACASAMAAWNALPSTTGKAGPAQAKAAAEQTFNMFSHEYTTMDALRTGFARVNNYPKLITKINKNDFKKGMGDIDKFISRLDEEKKYWNEILNNVTDENMLELWVREQISRIDAAKTPSAPLCTNVDLGKEYSFYDYTTSSSPCTTGYEEYATSGALSMNCKSASASWRGHWIKKVDTRGLNKLRITGDLILEDRSHFFTECSGRGVKYDNYADLLVLSENPNPLLQAECNKTAPQSEWPKCSIPNTSTSMLGHCGVPKCFANAKCDFTVDVAGKNEVYLNFQIHDAWMADIKGSLYNLQTCPVK